MSDLLHIDGSFGEGGGQILRTSLSLSCITGRPFEIHSIRANRSKPGLRPQHLQCVKAAAQICGGHVRGAEVGASRITFEPGEVQPGEYRFDIGTAGSTSLVFHTVVYPLSFAAGPSKVTITGGTHNPMSPCYHYLKLAWAPLLNEIGFSIDLDMKRAGFYPQGGGEIRATLEPAGTLKPIRLTDRGRLTEIRGLSTVADLPGHIIRRQADRAAAKLEALGLQCDVERRSMPAVSKGTMLLVNATFERGRACYFGLGEIRKRAERVADEACRDLGRFLESDATVDEHLADQLLLPLAFCEGESVFRTPVVTQHLVTNAEVVRMFWPVTVEAGRVGQEGLVRIAGRSSVDEAEQQNEHSGAGVLHDVGD